MITMNFFTLSRLILIGLLHGTSLSMAADFYISPAGSDLWSGTLKAPNEANKAAKQDGPFATLARARDAVRERKATTPAKNIVVQIRGGEYRLDETVVFGLADSGDDKTSITYKAFPGETPVFHSDVELGGWHRPKTAIPNLPAAAKGKVWVTTVPRDWAFKTLHDDAGSLPRARSAGFIPVMPESGRDKAKSSRMDLHFPPNTLRDWARPQDIELVVRPTHAWIVNILPLASIDMKRRMARVAVPATYAMNELHFLKGTPSVWFENAIDALDEPGEWVLEPATGRLILWPRATGRPSGISAPRLREYIRVEGDVDLDGPTDIPVRHLRFRGLTFTRGETYRLHRHDKGLQHDWDFQDKPNALLRLRATEHCTVEHCHFTQSGGGAIRVDLTGRYNQIRDNHIEHIGATGILLCGYGPGTKDANHNNLVINNHIHHVGEIYAHAPGIMLWQSGENRVAHNLIHYTPYCGMIVSGVMTQWFSSRNSFRELSRTFRWKEVGRPRRTWEAVRPFLHTHDNRIELNEIHHAMEQLGDGNGIYIRGAGSGNIIRRNYIHDLVATTTMQSAIRTDGGQRDTLITENLIVRCTSQGIQLKLDNQAVNNIIVDLRASIHNGEVRPPAYFKLREGPMTGAVIQRNILYHPGAGGAVFFDQGRTPRQPAAWAHEADTDRNLYYCAGDPTLAKATIKAGRRAGIDANSRAADPLFVDAAKGDFRFKPGSPAFELGILPIDTSTIGLRKQTPKP